MNQKGMFRKYQLRNYHFILILAVCLLTVIGILVIGSAEESVQNKQIMGFVIGFVLMILISLLDYSFILRFAWGYYALSVILLLLVQTPFGYSSGGSTRWIQIAGSFRFQPSEVAKILLILFFASYLAKRQENLNTFRQLLLCVVLLAVPLFFILIQPDLSTSIVLCLCFLCILFAAGLSYKVLLALLGVTVPTVVIGLIYLVNKASTIISLDDINYQMIRVYAWLFPDNPLFSSYSLQQRNSVMAIGSGQLLGKGLDNEDAISLLNGNYLSESQTDFIFSVVGEELGFLGAAICIVLLLAIVLECIFIGSRAKDMEGKLICCGMAALVGMQSFANISVTTGLLPNTGLPLPFVSYGLTSLISMFMGMGLVLNVGLQRQKK